MLSTSTRQRSSLSQSRPPASARGRSAPRGSTAVELPPYQPPEAPLTIESRQRLALLLQSHEFKGVKQHLADAVSELTATAGDINSRMVFARQQYEKQKISRNNDDDEENRSEGDGEDGGLQRLAEFETKVDEMTGHMEERMRKTIDSGKRLQDIFDTMKHIDKEEEEAQTAALGTRQTRAQRRRQQQTDGEENEGDDEDDEDYEGTPERQTREQNAQNPPSQRLADSLKNEAQEWDGLSLTERYTEHNDYIGFYRVVFESKFPPSQALPPLPHSSTWFSHLEDTSASRRTSAARTRNQQRESTADSDDIAIERERISLKCPLTLQYFQDPVTSSKCRHSFEREAIMGMMARAPYVADPERRGRRIRALKCPVCSVLLSAEDLRTDAALLRNVRRAEEARAREDEEMDEQGSRANEVTLGSDMINEDEMDVDDADSDSDRQIKSEPGLKIKREKSLIPNASQDVQTLVSSEPGEDSDVETASDSE